MPSGDGGSRRPRWRAVPWQSTFGAPPTTTAWQPRRMGGDDRSNRFDPGVTAVAGVFARILFYACERPLLSVIVIPELSRHPTQNSHTTQSFARVRINKNFFLSFIYLS